MKPEVLKNVLLIEAKDKQGYGVGVKNVHGRIQLYYGKEYGLDIASEQEVGTIVRIWLPVVEEERLEESRHEEDSKSV
jgi:two-component system, sensor histidine kinase YesM